MGIEPRGLLVIPLVEETGMVLLQLLKDHKRKLETAAGDSILWRPIGPPGWTDERYRRMRSERLASRDSADAEAYQREYEMVGGRDLYDREEFEKIPAQYGLQGYQRPLIGFITSPDTGKRAVLELDVRMLDTPERRRQLGAILCERITESAISEFSEGGIYTPDSIAKLQDYLDRVKAEIAEVADSTVSQAEYPAMPLLILRTIEDGRQRGTFVARLVGSGPFQGIDKKIGIRQLFFLYLLFESEEERRISGTERIVIRERRAVDELLTWSQSGYIKLQGADRDRPAHRVAKMWREFTRQIDRSSQVRGLFERIGRSNQDEEILYTMKLRAVQTQILIPSIPALLQK